MIPFGAFVEVADGVEGLVHASEFPLDVMTSEQEGSCGENCATARRSGRRPVRLLEGAADTLSINRSPQYTAGHLGLRPREGGAWADPPWS
ncbi:hypothetical protein ACWDLG_07315 [Nonomuraea sp. NPDC003727]